MLKFIKLETLEQFEALKKGDYLVVEWSDSSVRHTPNQKKIMKYKVYENKARQNEIICRLKGNHFFNYMMFLGLDTLGVNTSQALDIYKIEVIE